jgi:hypothetical protein
VQQIVYALVEFDTKDRMKILDIFRKLEDAQAEMKRVWERDLWKEDNDSMLLVIQEYPLR